MIDWYTWLQSGLAAASGVFCLIAGLLRRTPSDYTVGSLALVTVLLLGQVVVAIVSPFAGNPCAGDPVEFVIYLVTAVLIAVFGVVWALVDRTRWATVIMGVAALTLAIMLYRMQVIWTTPV